MLKTVGFPSTRTGDQTIVDGNLVIGTAGKGIDFSSDPNAPGMTSELLDDYEEGTWTPGWGVAAGSITANANSSGRYRKVGDTVTVWGYVSYESNAGAAGSIWVTGLPFTSGDGFGQGTAQSGGGVVYVPDGIDWGYVGRDITTYPNFSGVVNDVTVKDCSNVGDADLAGNKAGAQERIFFHTAQTSPAPGIHDGNGHHLHADWHPYYFVNSTVNLAPVGNPARTASDNRRASLFFGNDGETTWRWGQGTLAGASYTNEELSNFVLEHYQATGDTKANYAPLVIERKTGNWSFGGGSNVPESNYVFTPVSPGYYTMQIESLSATVTVVFRNSNGSGEDVLVRNVAGVFDVFIPAVGTAMSLDRDRNMVVAGYVKNGVSTVAGAGSAATAGVGARRFVTDALGPTWGNVVVGGGSAVVPIYSDGTNWVVG